MNSSSKFEEMIKGAQHQVEVWYDCVNSGRKWLKTSLNSYNDPEYEITLYVLQGSPAKGYVIANWGDRTIHMESVFNKRKIIRQHFWSSRGTQYGTPEIT